MKRSGFTMVELIFVIVIIGILAATALPKFKDVGKNATVANFTKIIGDIESGAVSAYTNEKQLVGSRDINLSNILTISGKDWNTSATVNNGTTGVSAYKLTDTINEINATITLCNGITGTGASCPNDANLTVYVQLGTSKVATELKSKMDVNSSGEYKKV